MDSADELVDKLLCCAVVLFVFGLNYHYVAVFEQQFIKQTDVI